MWVSLILFCEGGHFTLEPYIYKKVFGEKMAVKAYGVGFSFTGLANITILILVTSLNKAAGPEESPLESYINLIYFGVGLSVFSLLLMLLFFNEEPIFKENDDDYTRYENNNKLIEVESDATRSDSETEQICG